MCAWMLCVRVSYPSTSVSLHELHELHTFILGCAVFSQQQHLRGEGVVVVVVLEDVWCMRGASEETVRGREVLPSLCLIERREKGKGKWKREGLVAVGIARRSVFRCRVLCGFRLRGGWGTRVWANLLERKHPTMSLRACMSTQRA